MGTEEREEGGRRERKGGKDKGKEGKFCKSLEKNPKSFHRVTEFRTKFSTRNLQYLIGVTLG